MSLPVKISPMNQRRRDVGFTLIELLVAMALLGVLLTAVVAFNISTSRSAAALQARNELLPELQNVQNYMASKLKQAVYVFPTGTVVNMGSGYSTTNPSGGNSWTIGTDPIVAFILPPSAPASGQCASSPGPETCYAFYAFYAMKRSTLVAKAAGANNPGADAGNDGSAWVLMEYRANYAPPGFNPAVITRGLTGRLLMDDLAPTTQTGTDDARQLFTQVDGAQTPGVTAVTLQLGARRSVAGQSVRVPVPTPAASRDTLTVYPRNVGKPAVPN